MATHIFKVDVSYSQIAVFCSSTNQPFNDWTQKHVDQGFAWRKCSVSFRTLVEFGMHSVEVVILDYLPEVSSNVLRAIDVPFDIEKDSDISIASIADSALFGLLHGSYALRCEFLGLDCDGFQKVRLLFARHDIPHFSIAKGDKDVSESVELIKFANAAL